MGSGYDMIIISGSIILVIIMQIIIVSMTKWIKQIIILLILYIIMIIMLIIMKQEFPSESIIDFAIVIVLFGMGLITIDSIIKGIEEYRKYLKNFPKEIMRKLKNTIYKKKESHFIKTKQKSYEDKLVGWFESPDLPITNENDDIFKFNEDVEKTTSLIINNIKKNQFGYSYNINAKWGDGKSSYLNLLKRSIKRAMISEKLDIRLVEFNPLIYTQQREMINGLLEGLAESLPYAMESIIYNFLQSIELNTSIFKVNMDVLLRKPKNPIKILKEIEEKLVKMDIYVIILIDEIDRLNTDQMKCFIPWSIYLKNKRTSLIYAGDIDKIRENISGGC